MNLMINALEKLAKFSLDAIIFNFENNQLKLLANSFRSARDRTLHVPVAGAGRRPDAGHLLHLGR